MQLRLLATAAALAVTSLLAQPAAASVSVNTKTGNAQFVNDGDNGLYISNGSTSARKGQADVYSQPVSASKTVRWDACSTAPCPDEPTPSAAPGPPGAKVIRKLTPAELSFYGTLQAKVELPKPIANLKAAMAISSERLGYVSVQSLGEAMQPTRDALALVNDPENPYVLNARKALVLSAAWANTRRLIIDAEVHGEEFRRAWGGEFPVPCNSMNDLINAFNQEAGYKAVDLQFGKNIFNACRYKSGPIEDAMLAAVRRALANEPTPDPLVFTYDTKSFLK
ncbi:hypothetical protein KBY58_09750 [Cyanobium sp. HWJ4-Hawea]|uniref:hypothetical protein n=1 Tax=Cyanobium sp. HWJ4-Hawea TaxID=2823713 RepID=UPI0020CF7E09|nr:hypothetical protein [Cyanobium sp. HWJ4-Hawea]MCP9809715.1 hypothetical protein [Cyanobium sp. HWJ4-Hawea]